MRWARRAPLLNFLPWNAGAREALAEAPGLGESAGAGNIWAAFLHANLARLENREWADQVLDKRIKAGGRPYSAWLYVEATARQPCRELENALHRLEQAIILLRHEAGGMPGNVCNLFAAFLELDAAAMSEDARRWTAAVAGTLCFLLVAPDHRNYYGAAVDTLPSVPNLTAAERLLDLVPYF